LEFEDVEEEYPMISVDINDIKQVMIPLSKQNIWNWVQAGAACIFKLKIEKEKFEKLIRKKNLS